MSNDFQRIVNQIEEAYDPTSRNQQQALNYITKLSTSDNSLEIAEGLFEFPDHPRVINVAINILKRNISQDWNAMPKDYRDSIKTFIMQRLSSFEDQSINNQLASLCAIAATKDFPNDWPTFFEDIFNLTPPAFDVLSNFFSLVTNSDSTEITPLQSKLINEKIQANKKEIIQKCIEAIPLPTAANCLIEFTPYFKWEDVDSSKFGEIVMSDNPDCFGTMCAIGCIEGFPDNLVGDLFQKLYDLALIIYENNDESTFNRIIPFLLKYQEILESQDYLLKDNDLLLKVAAFDLTTHLDFWESFTLSIFNSYKTTGSTDRFSAHQDVLEELTTYVLRHMPQPPGFILPGEGDTSLDEGARMEYNQMRNIFISTLTIEPTRILPKIHEIFSELEQRWHPQVFCSLIWSISCIAGATGSIVEGKFIIDSLTFILKAFKAMSEDKDTQALIAAGFLFLVSSYAKAQKLTSQFIQIALKLATTGLLSDNLRKMSTLCIHSLGTNCASLVNTLPDVDELITQAVEVPYDQFTDCLEGFGRIYQEKGKLNTLIGITLRRWEAAKTFDNNNDIIISATFSLAAFLGLAKVDAALITEVITDILKDILAILKESIESTVQLTSFDGQPEEKAMYNFIITTAVLFKVCGIKNCKMIFEFYQNADPIIRPIEILQLADSLLKTELTDEEAVEIHTSVIDPTKEMIATDDWIDPSFPSLLPSVINIYLQAHFAASMVGEPCIIEEDLHFLLNLIRRTNHTSILASLNAIEMTLNKADLTLTGEDRQGFFRLFFIDILQSILFVSTEPSHRFCLDKLIAFIHKLFLYISAERLQVALYDPPQTNAEGAVLALMEALLPQLPSISKQNMKILMEAFINSESLQETQDLMINFISAARQTVPGEIMRHIQMKKMKSYIEQTGWADCEN